MEREVGEGARHDGDLPRLKDAKNGQGTLHDMTLTLTAFG